MPQLVAFNRRWSIGSDDFVFPGLIEIVLRLIWLIAVSVVFHLHRDTFDCTGGELLKTYYIGLLTLLVVSIIMTFAVVYVSCQGSITNIAPRRRMSKLIYVKCAISFPELAWNVMGSLWAFSESTGCEVHVVTTVKAVVLSGWVIGLIVIIGIAIVFDPLGKLHQTDDNGSMEEAKRVWETRCRLLCCCVGRDEQTTNAFNGIAEILSQFFKGVDLVPTDIACGLILIHRNQKRKNADLSCISVQSEDPERHVDPTSSSSTSIIARPIPSGATVDGSLDTRPTLAVPKPWMTIDMMWHYMKFAMGSYGWPLYVFAHLMTGTCQLWTQCNNACMSWCLDVNSGYFSCLGCIAQCKTHMSTLIQTEKEMHELCMSLECCACMLQQKDIQDDNCCRCNVAAIKRTTGVHPDDIVYASFHDKIYEIPFYVCIDRQNQAVVISIRGTLSLRDVMTDLTANCESLDIDGVHSFHAHKGMVQAARYVQSTLERHHILEQAFDRAQGAKLVITGHSLGAGTAALLAVMLKPKYPDLICFSFSPPGGLMSLEASHYSQEFICSVVLGKDIIPRLGTHTMEELRTSLLRQIHDCDLPKYKLLASGVWQLFCGLAEDKQEDEVDAVHQKRPLLDSSQYTDQPGLQNALHEAVQHSEQCRITHTRMYPPGQIVHILETARNKRCCGVPDYWARWSKAEDFQEVLVSPSMLSDHLPDAVMRALDQLKEKNYIPTLHRPGSIITV